MSHPPTVGDCEALGRLLIGYGSFCQPEVEHLHDIGGGDLDIGGLEIAMDDALAVGSLKRLGYLPRNRQRFDERKRTALDPVRERDAFDEFEDQGWPAMRLFEPIDGAMCG